MTAAKPPRQIGMRDVARRAGVGTMTVSRVLSNPEQVSPQTRRRVMEAIEALGYVPNRLAQGFGSSRSKLVGVIVPTVSNLMFGDKIESLSEVLRPHGYQLLVAHNAYSLRAEEELVESLVSQRPCAMVLTGLMHTARTARLLHQAAVPTVETWNLGRPPIDMLVGFSNQDAARDMVLRLAQRGYRHIALVHPHPQANDRAQDRLAGYRTAMREAGLPWRPELERACDFGFANGAAALRDLLAQVRPLDAVFFANDALAAGALLACRRDGIAVPGTIGIAGFDDVDLAAQLDPPLTTVRIPMRAMGRRAAELLLTRLQGAPVASPVVDLGYEIVERGSTISPNGR